MNDKLTTNVPPYYLDPDTVPGMREAIDMARAYVAHIQNYRLEKATICGLRLVATSFDVV